MAKHVKSVNQSGGTTAETVNIDNAGNIGVTKPEGRGWWRWLFRLAAIAAIIGTIIVAMDYFNEESASMSPDNDQNIFNVSSLNQSGGITAGQVNIGPQPRHVDDGAKRQLLDLIAARPGASISVTAVLGDGEAYGFAQEIKDFLVAEGHDVDGINQAVFNGRLVGQDVNPEPDRIDIRIGHQQ